jgi:hypothetical protein
VDDLEYWAAWRRLAEAEPKDSADEAISLLRHQTKSSNASADPDGSGRRSRLMVLTRIDSDPAARERWTDALREGAGKVRR